MRIIPPYPDYPYFRKPWTDFRDEVLCDLSILAYSSEREIERTKFPLGMRIIGFIRDRAYGTDTQAFMVADACNNVAVAFRGTETFNLRDWETDFNVAQNSEGIHRGFFAGYESIRGQVDKLLRSMNVFGHVFLTGHSLGAALATVAAWHPPGVKHTLVTFGSPRVGSQEFATDVMSKLERRVTRYVHGSDAVTGLPCWTWGYHHVGPDTKIPQQPKPWGWPPAVFCPRPVYDHVPTLYGDYLWQVH